MSQPDSLVGAGDKTRDIGHPDCGVVVVNDRSDNGMQGCKRVRSHFRMRVTDDGQQRRLSGIGVADNADVRHYLQFQGDELLFPLHPVRMLARRPVPWPLPMAIAQSTLATLCHHKCHSVRHEIAKRIAACLVMHNCPARHRNHQVGSIPTMTILALAMPPVLRMPLRHIEDAYQGIDVLVGAQNHIPAPAAVTAIRAASLNEFFTAETDTAVPSVAC